ncbi:hypothetical protein ANAPH2_01534 [Anaplasma phagocytophilum]|nr:hypothetical protein ANAPH2_01534 [Anaplasma phagocytophilum]
MPFGPIMWILVRHVSALEAYHLEFLAVSLHSGHSSVPRFQEHFLGMEMLG